MMQIMFCNLFFCQATFLFFSSQIQRDNFPAPGEERRGEQGREEKRRRRDDGRGFKVVSLSV